MNQLSFQGHSNTEWREYKKIMREMFWTDFENKRRKDARELIQRNINEEFNIQIGASKYERKQERKDVRNGYRDRTFEIMNNHIACIRVPRARKMDIRFSAFDLWQRVQPQVLNAILKAYLYSRGSGSCQEIIQAFGQSRFSKTFIQKLVIQFEKKLEKFHNSRITKKWPYIFIDGMAVKFYDGLDLKKRVVLLAMGMDHDKQKRILGWVTVRSEHETAVRSLLVYLKDKSLSDPDLFITDGSKGIIQALKLEFPHTPRQLCAFHKIHNIQDNLLDKNNRQPMMREAGDIYKYSSTRKESIEKLGIFIKNWNKKEPEATRLFKSGFVRTLTYFDFPKKDWISIYTTNPIEQKNQKIRDWFMRFRYFRGNKNLDSALFSYIEMREINEEVSVSEKLKTFQNVHTFV